MPTCTRRGSWLPRTYLGDARLNGLRDPLAREVFFRLKIAADNVGRLPGNPATVAGILFPSQPLPPAKMEKVLRQLADAGLILRYKTGKNQSFIAIADAGLTQKIVGHMTKTSEYPAPLLSLVREWEKQTGSKWVPVGGASPEKQRPNDTPEYELSSNLVHTAFELSSSESETESETETESELVSKISMNSDSLTPTCEAGGSVEPPNPQTEPCKIRTTSGTFEKACAEWTGGEFDPGIGLRGYPEPERFRAVVVDVCEKFSARPNTEATRAEFAAAVLDACNALHFDAPAGWVRSLYRLREQVPAAETAAGAERLRELGQAMAADAAIEDKKHGEWLDRVKAEQEEGRKLRERIEREGF